MEARILDLVQIDPDDLSHVLEEDLTERDKGLAAENKVTAAKLTTLDPKLARKLPTTGPRPDDYDVVNGDDLNRIYEWSGGPADPETATISAESVTGTRQEKLERGRVVRVGRHGRGAGARAERQQLAVGARSG